MKKIEFDNDVFVIDEFITNESCEDYIALSENIGYEEAKVQIDGKQTMFKGIRNNSRILLENQELAENLYQLVKPFCPEKIDNWTISGLNEMFRFYKYEPGQRFKKHIDGTFKRNETEVSKLTFLIYLNSDFDGGETSFDNFTVNPKKGSALVFKHELKHQGNEILSGVKYVLRTDIMYKLNN